MDAERKVPGALVGRVIDRTKLSTLCCHGVEGARRIHRCRLQLSVQDVKTHVEAADHVPLRT